MTLRLSSFDAPPSSHPFTSCGNPTFDRILQDSALSTSQKLDCLKTVRVIIKNLMDPSKSQDIKYRTLKLDNPKLQDKLWKVGPYLQQDFFQSMLDFEIQQGTDDGNGSGSSSSNTLCRKDAPSTFMIQSVLTPIYNSLQTAVERLTVNNNDQNDDIMAKKQKLLLKSSSTVSSTSTTTTTTSQPPMEKLSEKQKARRLLEEKEKAERQKAKEDRQRQLKLLKEDKHTRLNDPNWKPGLSAACAKSGSSISTFRDKYGEN